MSYFPYLEDKEFLKQLDEERYREIYIRIEVLDFTTEQTIANIEGKSTGGSINLNGTSNMRRSGSLSMVVDPNGIDIGGESQDYYAITDVQNLISMNKKIRVFSGVRNTIGDPWSQYDIIWFPLGVYVIKSGNAARNGGGINLSLTTNDKCALLNGDMGGTIPAATIFSESELYNSTGTTRTVEPVLIKDMVKRIVVEFGGEKPENVIIEDIPEYIVKVIKWTGKDPLYLITTNGHKQYTLEKPTEGSNLEYKTFVYGQDVGYMNEPFVYPGRLECNAGESAASVLDKLKNTLGNFEWFYDVHGRFHFQEIKNYLNTSLSTEILNLSESDYLMTMNPTMSSYIFDNHNIITSISNAPQYANIKNDFVVWGTRKTSTGVQKPIRYHLAFEDKPTLRSKPMDALVYEDYRGLQSVVKLDESNFNDKPTLIDKEVPMEIAYLQDETCKIINETVIKTAELQKEFVVSEFTYIYDEDIGEFSYKSEIYIGEHEENVSESSNIEVSETVTSLTLPEPKENYSIKEEPITISSEIENVGNPTYDRSNITDQSEFIKNLFTFGQTIDGLLETEEGVSIQEASLEWCNESDYRPKMNSSYEYSFEYLNDTEPYPIFYIGNRNLPFESLPILGIVLNGQSNEYTGWYWNASGGFIGCNLSSFVDLHSYFYLDLNLSAFYPETNYPVYIDIYTNLVFVDNFSIQNYLYFIDRESENALDYEVLETENLTVLRIYPNNSQRNFLKIEIVDANSILNGGYLSQDSDSTLKFNGIVASNCMRYTATGIKKYQNQIKTERTLLTTTEYLYTEPEIVKTDIMKTINVPKLTKDSPKVYYLAENTIWAWDDELKDFREFPNYKYCKLLPGDWRTELYFQGLEASDKTFSRNYYAAELNAEWPKICDVLGGTPLKDVEMGEEYISAYWPDQKTDLYEYWLDFIEASDFSINNIGRRVKVITDNNSNCLFPVEVPNYIIVEADGDVTSERGLAEKKRQEVIQVSPSIFKNLSLGGSQNAAFDKIKELLNTHTQYNESVTLSVIPIYYLEPNTRITINDPQMGIQGDYLIKSISLPLTASGTSNISCTKALSKTI